ncbi:MAG: hypothetical protein ACR2P8_08385, partial [Myxococcota bacterium]
MGDAAASPVARPRIRRRLRLIAVGLVLLPTVALLLLAQALQQVEDESRVREGAERQARLRAAAEALARGLEGLLPGEPRERFRLIEATRPGELVAAVELDGSCADWRVAGLVDPEPCASAGLLFDRVEWLSEHRDDYDPSDFSFRIRAARRDEHLHVYVEVVDDELIVRQRDLDDGDQLRIVAALPAEGGASLPVRFVSSYRPGAEGRMTTVQVERSWRRPVAERARLPWGDAGLSPTRRPAGVWRKTADGYRAELRLP